MEKTNIAQGQMFIHFDASYMEKPRVWVKVSNKVFGSHHGENKEEVSVFVDNAAIVKFAVNGRQPSIVDKWNISDGYYGRMVREGKFIPIDGLRETDDICEQVGWPKYEVDLGL